jgi:tRNA/tmRNA/rRNA uracil-C5-methylase (TrmA/RlmC/RlmD family)
MQQVKRKSLEEDLQYLYSTYRNRYTLHVKQERDTENWILYGEDTNSKQISTSGNCQQLHKHNNLKANSPSELIHKKYNTHRVFITAHGLLRLWVLLVFYVIN